MCRKRLCPVLATILFTLLTVYACDPISEADDVTLPVIEPKLVLNAYVIPQHDMQQIFVATSLPLNYDLSDYYKSVSHFSDSWRLSYKGVIPDATVRFTDLDNNVTITPIFSTKHLAYIFTASDMTIREGGNYEVEVSYRDYPPIKESFVVPKGTKPSIECEDEGLATLVRIHAKREPERYFCVYMNMGLKNVDIQQQFTYFVSTATSIDGAITIRRRSISPFGDWDGENRMKLESVQLWELDERTFLYFTALEKNQHVQDNPFASPSLLRNYVKDGFGIAAGIIDHGKLSP